MNYQVGQVISAKPFFGNQHVRRAKWVAFKSWLSLWFWRLKVATAVAAMVSVAFIVGTYQNTISVTNTVVTPNTSGIPPILQKIAHAESSGEQFGSHGQVTFNINRDGTVDMGKYQINSRWFALASKMGYNLAVEKDNEAFALYLFNNYGSEPWSSSKSRWNI